MPKLRSVSFWPESGHPDQLWGEDDSPAVDAWARTSRRVCERYSEGLRQAAIENRVGTVRFTATSTQDDVVLIDPNLKLNGGWEGGAVQIPAAVVTLTPEQRARLVLDTVHVAMQRLAEVRGWPVEVLDQCAGHVIRANYGFSWISDTKTDRKRRYRARLLIDLDDDGYGRCVVELIDAKTEVPIGRSEPLMAFTTIKGFRRSFASLHWNNDSTLTLDHYSDPFGVFNQTATLAPGSDFGWRASAAPPDTEPPPSPIKIAVPAPVARIRGGGGGPMNYVPEGYRRVVNSFFGGQVEPDLIGWWSQTGLIELWVDFDYSPGTRSGVRLYEREQDLTARVRRPTPDAAVNDNAAATAGEDLRAVFEAVRKRFNLSSPPLPRTLA